MIRKTLSRQLIGPFGLLIFIGQFLALGAYAQESEKHPGFIRRYINKLVNDTTSITEPQFIMYPTLAYAPETSWEIGLSSLYIYYARKDTTNRLSEVNGFVFYTLNRQYGAWFDHALYSHGNRFSLLGRVRYQNFPLLYYGIGPNTPSEELATVAAQQINVRERVLRKIGHNLFAGPEVDFQSLSAVRFEVHDHTNFTDPRGSEGSTNIGLGGGIVYDNRHNVLNVRKGGFAELALLHYNGAWGSDYGFTSIISDNRMYLPVKKNNVLAAQVFGQLMNGTPPFNQLSLLGGESLMRGYYSGRFRDRNQIAAQVEYRMLPLPLPFTSRLGAAVFGGAGTVFNQFSQLSNRDIKWAGGAGVRYLIYPKKDIFTRIDLAFTKEGRGIYFFIGEAF